MRGVSHAVGVLLHAGNRSFRRGKVVIEIEHRCDPIRPPAFQTTQRCEGFRLDHTINSRDAVSCGLHYPHLARGEYAAASAKTIGGGATQRPRSALESRCSGKIGVSCSCAKQYAGPGQRVLPHANVSAPRRGYTRKLAASRSNTLSGMLECGSCPPNVSCRCSSRLRAPP